MIHAWRLNALHIALHEQESQHPDQCRMLWPHPSGGRYRTEKATHKTMTRMTNASLYQAKLTLSFDFNKRTSDDLAPIASR